MTGTRDGLRIRPDLLDRKWTCYRVRDFGTPDFACQACGYPYVRYIHMLRADDNGQLIDSGCVCSGTLCGDMKAAKEREKMLLSRVRAKKMLGGVVWGPPNEKGVRRAACANFRLYMRRTARGWKPGIRDKSASGEYPSWGIEREELDKAIGDLAAALVERRRKQKEAKVRRNFEVSL